MDFAYHDSAYHMVFGAHVLFVLKWEPDTGWADQVNSIDPRHHSAPSARAGRVRCRR